MCLINDEAIAHYIPKRIFGDVSLVLDLREIAR